MVSATRRTVNRPTDAAQWNQPKRPVM